MRGAAETMEVIRPKNSAEAVGALAARPDSLVLAGGTDVMVSWNAGLLNGRRVVDLSRVSEWTKIEPAAGGLRLGALATHMSLRRHPVVRKDYPLLSQACATIGAAQIQNRGTIGGNIANASPAGDTFPPLAVYEAAVLTVGAEGRRAVPVSQIFAGVKKTTLKPGELIEGVMLPGLPRKPSRQMFRKVGTRAAQAISKVVAAGLLWLTKDGTVEEFRFALGSVAPTVKRLSAVEQFLNGRKLSTAVIAEACGLLDADISPIDDIRSTRQYRLSVSRNILKAFLEARP